VQNVPSEVESPPAIVSISDTHGYFDDPRQALLTLRDYFVIESVVTVDSDDLPN
jgi:hypothetical protein